MSETDLESIYSQARQAIKAKDNDRATGLLKQILVIDENYKDASRLLARLVKEKRRRWYNDVRVLVVVIGVIIVGLLVWIAPKLSLQAIFTSPTMPVSPTETSFPTQITSPIVIPSATTIPSPTLIPLVWKRISIGQEYSRSMITTIVIDPKDRDVIYIGTWGAGVYKSIDGGLSWRPSLVGLNRGYVDNLVINPQNSQNLFAALDLGGLFRSDDGGITWIDMGRGRGCGESFIYLDPVDSNHLLGGVGCESLTESHDGGKIWGSALNGSLSKELWNPTSIVIHPTDKNIMLLAQWDLGIYRSLDEGLTWTLMPIPGKYFDGQQKTAIALDPTGQATFLVASENGLFVSFDNGDKWNTPITEPCSAIFADHKGNAIASCGDLLKSVDGGHSWEKINSSDGHGRISALSISPHDPNILIAAGNGLSISKDGGKSWVEASNGIPATCMDLQINPSNPENLFAIEYCSGSNLFQSLNSGKKWDVLNYKNGMVDFAIDAGGQLFYRLDQGQLFQVKDKTITKELQLPYGANEIETNPYLPGIVYTIADKKFYYSENEGFSWNAGSGFSATTNGVFAFGLEPKVIYMINQEGDMVFQYSDNNGKTWQACGSRPEGQTRYLSKSIFVVDPRDSNHLYLASLDRGVLVSKDGCLTWGSSSKGIENQSVNTLAVNPNNPDTIYAGTDIGAYVSIDSGRTWNQINSGLLGATVVYSIIVDKDSNVYAATPYGIFKLESI